MLEVLYLSKGTAECVGYQPRATLDETTLNLRYMDSTTYLYEAWLSLLCSQPRMSGNRLTCGYTTAKMVLRASTKSIRSA